MSGEDGWARIWCPSKTDCGSETNLRTGSKLTTRPSCTEYRGQPRPEYLDSPVSGSNFIAILMDGMNGSTCVPVACLLSDSNESHPGGFLPLQRPKRVAAKAVTFPLASDADPAMRRSTRGDSDRPSSPATQPPVYLLIAHPGGATRNRVDLLSWQEWQKRHGYHIE